MPPKYRQMGDFYEYYSGARKAPYTTIFVGGNHEASNHLYELSYGGWAAPNIYYMGAANVIRFGPLRIAGLSGIWKGYDFRKPHFERLPYNREEINSIYHVRELDVRKLLCLRSQVDIGLSHDWPQGVEYWGDKEWLFRTKNSFERDSVIGKLGSPAASQILDRLRPPFWFSAHLHTRFAAKIEHNQEEPTEAETASRHSNVDDDGYEGDEVHENHENDDPTGDAGGPNTAPATTSTSTAHNGSNIRLPGDSQQVAAWNQFHVSAKRADDEEREKILKEREALRLEMETSGRRAGRNYTIQETFKQIGSSSGGDRKVVSTTKSQHNSAEDRQRPAPIPNLDGHFCSRPDQEMAPDENEPLLSNDATSNYAGVEDASGADQSNVAVANPDAIDIDSSGDEGDGVALPVVPLRFSPPRPRQPMTYGRQAFGSGASEAAGTNHSAISVDSRGGRDGVVPDANNQDSAPVPSVASRDAAGQPSASRDLARVASQISSLGGTDPLALLFRGSNSSIQSSKGKGKEVIDESIQSGKGKGKSEEHGNEVSKEMRAHLASLSSSFTKKEKIESSPPLPFPQGISNDKTMFLALGKCEVYQEFLQLLPISSITAADAETQPRPFKLTYDPEWLAIQRVFAPELELGGNPTDQVPMNRGETYYREQIDKEMEWINEFVVEPNLLEVPENFEITAPIFDASLDIREEEQPREVSNPQTALYCSLIGIGNKFDISEEERDARMQAGPRPESAGFLDYQNRPRGFGHGRGGGSSGSSGSRGRGGGGFRAPSHQSSSSSSLRGSFRGGSRGRGRGHY